MAFSLSVPLPPQVPPTRPPMPTVADQLRSARQANRWAILTEDWELLLEKWLEPRIGAERLAQWGEGDTSANILADTCRQFSTPGLYGSRPEVRHADPAAQPMIGPEGHLDRAGLWTMMQSVQYKTFGLGDLPVFVDCTEAEGLAFQVVPPADVWVWSTQARPDVPVIVAWLRLYPLTVGNDTTWIYAWDTYDRGGQAAPGQPARLPSFKVLAASGDYANQDITALVVAETPAGGFVGEDYRWTRQDGTAFLPWVFYRAVDSKQQWNIDHMLGATKGTLNGAANWTYAQHCARDASGTAVIAAGLVPIVGNVQNAGEAGKVSSVQLSPGAILYHQVQDGAQPFVSEVGPGGNLEQVSAYAHGYEARQLVRLGLSAEDVEKGSADPASGAALYISNEAKRRRAEMMRPLFERADREMLSVCAELLRICGLGDYPTTGYSIDYAQIPRSAEERRADREETDWSLEHGHISELDAYRQAHPGASEEDAIAALTKAAVDAARLEAAKAQAIAAAGLTAAPVEPATPAP